MFAGLLIGLAAAAGEASGAPFRLLASTDNCGARTNSVVALWTDPVAELPVIGRTDYLAALDTDPSGQLYGVASQLYRVDLTNKTVISMGIIHTATHPSLTAVGMAFAPDGTLYAVINNALYTIDPATCRATEVGPISLLYGIDFAPDGRLFGAGLYLYQLDPATGQVLTNLGTLPSLTVDIDFAADGFIYGVTYNHSGLLRINPDTGESELIGTYQSCLRGLASGAFPELKNVLGDCLEATNLPWWTGGDADWFSQTNTCHDGVDGAQSGAITNNQTTWMQTVVQGPGILSFWWTVSCDGGDALEFFLDDVEQNSINYTPAWSEERYLIPAGSHTLRWAYSKNSYDAGSYYDYAGWVDEVVFTPATLPVFFEQPHDRTALWGDALSLETVIIGVEPLSYQWRSNNVAVAGQTNAAYRLNFAQTNDSALYSLVATNRYGAVTSAPVRLHVLNLQQQWQRTLGGANTDIARGLETLPDGRCIVGGWSSSSSGDGTKTSTNWGQIDFWLTCLDSAGESVWDKSFGGVANDVMFGSFCVATNGDYVMAGISVTPYSGPVGGNKTSTNYGAYDGWTVRCDSNGNKVSGWDVTLGGTEDDYFQAVRPTSDGGFILAGYSESETGGNKTGTNYGWDDYLVVRLAADGTCMWDKTFGGSRWDEAYDVRPTSDGGFLVAGDSDSPADGNKTSTNYNRSRDVWLVKLDRDGNRLWDKSYGGDSSDYLYCLSPTPDNGWIFAASSYSETNECKTAPRLGGADLWVVRLDADGNVLWQRTFGGALSEAPAEITPTGDGGFLIAGSSSSGFGIEKTSPNFGGDDGWLVRLDGDGNRLWDYSFGGDSNDRFNAVRETPDGGLALAGFSWSPPGGNKTTPAFGGADAWVVKLAPPLSPASFSLSATWADGGCLVSLLGGHAGDTYRLQRSDDLIHWQDWKTVTNAGAVIQRLDTVTPDAPCRFYRATLVP